MSTLRIHAAVLAGGRSVRMNTDKRFLKIQGELLVDRAVRLAQEATVDFGGEVYLCGDVPGRQSLPDRTSGIGPLSGLFTAIESVMNSESPEARWLLVIPVDMPFLSSELLHELTSEVRCSSHLGVQAIGFDDFEMPFIVRASHSSRIVVQDLIQAINPSDRSIREFLKRLEVKRIKLDLKFRNSMTNANLPSDWVCVCEEVLKDEFKTK